VVHLNQSRDSSGTAGNAYVTIQTDLLGQPSGVVLGTSNTIDASTFASDDGSCTASTATDYTITGLSLSASTDYWIVMQLSATHAPPNIPYDCVENTTPRLSYNETGTWNTYPSDRELVGSIDLSTGGGGGGGGATTTIVATSTVEQTQQNVWQAYWVFFSMLVFVVWLGRTR